jgi:excisionase family DNA binding protein
VITETKPQTLSVEETAALLGIGRTNAYELARRGELPGSFRLGRKLLVSKPALDRFLADPSGGSR